MPDAHNLPNLLFYFFFFISKMFSRVTILYHHVRDISNTNRVLRQKENYIDIISRQLPKMKDIRLKIQMLV